MLPLLLICLIASAVSAPYYDQRQDGDFNVRADVQNVVFLVAIPKKIPNSIFDGFFKSAKQSTNEDAQERADIQMVEAFVEPNKPYEVDLSAEGQKENEADGRAVEVVIAGRRRLETDIQPEKGEYKLIGATEQCGPEMERDPVTLICRLSSSVSPTKIPEVVLSSA